MRFSCNKSHVCASKHCTVCNGISHFACRVIGNIPYRIYGFTGRSGSYKYFLSDKSLLHAIDLKIYEISTSSEGIFPVPIAPHARRPLSGGITVQPYFFSFSILSCTTGFYKHISIHSRSNNFVAPTCKCSSSQHIVCNTVCQLTDNICGCRSYQQYVCFLGG